MKKKINRKLFAKIGVMIAIMTAFLVLDLVTKYHYNNALELDGEPIKIIPSLFNFKLVHNYGAAWGIMAGKQVFLIVLSLLFLAVFVFYYIKEKNKTWLLNIAFGFLFAGCLGNLYDRMILGYVRDFIQFDFWKTFPVFNFADVALFVGIILFFVYLTVYYFKHQKTDQKKGKKND